MENPPPAVLEPETGSTGEQRRHWSDDGGGSVLDGARGNEGDGDTRLGHLQVPAEDRGPDRRGASSGRATGPGEEKPVITSSSSSSQQNIDDSSKDKPKSIPLTVIIGCSVGALVFALVLHRLG